VHHSRPCNIYAERRSSGSNALNSVPNPQCSVLVVSLQPWTSAHIYSQLFLTCLFEQNDMTWSTTQYSCLASNIHSMQLYSKSIQVGSKLTCSKTQVAVTALSKFGGRLTCADQPHLTPNPQVDLLGSTRLDGVDSQV